MNALAAELKAQMGVIDGALINAEAAKFSPQTRVDETVWDTSFDAYVKGPHFPIQYLATLMLWGNSMVLNGSIHVYIGMPNSCVYAASKAALISPH